MKRIPATAVPTTSAAAATATATTAIQSTGVSPSAKLQQQLPFQQQGQGQGQTQPQQQVHQRFTVFPIPQIIPQTPELTIQKQPITMHSSLRFTKKPVQAIQQVLHIIPSIEERLNAAKYQEVPNQNSVKMKSVDNEFTRKATLTPQKQQQLQFQLQQLPFPQQIPFNANFRPASHQIVLTDKPYMRFMPSSILHKNTNNSNINTITNTTKGSQGKRGSESEDITTASNPLTSITYENIRGSANGGVQSTTGGATELKSQIEMKETFDNSQQPSNSTNQQQQQQQQLISQGKISQPEEQQQQQQRNHRVRLNLPSEKSRLANIESNDDHIFLNRNVRQPHQHRAFQIYQHKLSLQQQQQQQQQQQPHHQHQFQVYQGINPFQQTPHSQYQIQQPPPVAITATTTTAGLQEFDADIFKHPATSDRVNNFSRLALDALLRQRADIFLQEDSLVQHNRANAAAISNAQTAIQIAVATSTTAAATSAMKNLYPQQQHHQSSNSNQTRNNPKRNSAEVSIIPSPFSAAAGAPHFHKQNTSSNHSTSNNNNNNNNTNTLLSPNHIKQHQQQQQQQQLSYLYHMQQQQQHQQLPSIVQSQLPQPKQPYEDISQPQQNFTSTQTIIFSRNVSQHAPNNIPERTGVGLKANSTHINYPQSNQSQSSNQGDYQQAQKPQQQQQQQQQQKSLLISTSLLKDQSGRMINKPTTARQSIINGASHSLPDNSSSLLIGGNNSQIRHQTNQQQIGNSSTKLESSCKSVDYSGTPKHAGMAAGQAMLHSQQLVESSTITSKNNLYFTTPEKPETMPTLPQSSQQIPQPTSSNNSNQQRGIRSTTFAPSSSLAARTNKDIVVKSTTYKPNNSNSQNKNANNNNNNRQTSQHQSRGGRNNQQIASASSNNKTKQTPLTTALLTAKVQNHMNCSSQNTNAPEVSSKGWAVLSCSSDAQATPSSYPLSFLAGKNANFPVEVASLTKIMTCYLTLCFFESHVDLDLHSVYFEVSSEATEMIGTSANLEKGDYVSAYELLFGLMLPSGNDAAVVLSEGVGYLLLRLENRQPFGLSVLIAGEKNCIAVNAKLKKEVGGVAACTNAFLREMNRFAREIGMEKTNYACVHGLPHRSNVSSAKDIATLSCVAMQHPLFAKVVNTQEYDSKHVYDAHLSQEAQYEWENTNFMLEKNGYDGVKTGVTETAGPCLSTSYKVSRNATNIRILCVLLNCKSMDDRWTETKDLVQWALKTFHPEKQEESNL